MREVLPMEDGIDQSVTRVNEILDEINTLDAKTLYICHKADSDPSSPFEGIDKIMQGKQKLTSLLIELAPLLERLNSQTSDFVGQMAGSASVDIPFLNERIATAHMFNRIYNTYLKFPLFSEHCPSIGEFICGKRNLLFKEKPSSTAENPAYYFVCDAYALYFSDALNYGRAEEVSPFLKILRDSGKILGIFKTNSAKYPNIYVGKPVFYCFKPLILKTGEIFLPNGIYSFFAGVTTELGKSNPEVSLSDFSGCLQCLESSLLYQGLEVRSSVIVELKSIAEDL